MYQYDMTTCRVSNIKKYNGISFAIEFSCIKYTFVITILKKIICNMPKAISKTTCLRSILIFTFLIMCFVMISEVLHSDVYAGAKETGILNGDSVKGSPFDGYKGYTRVISTLLVVIALIIATLYVLKKKYGVRANIGGKRKLIQVVDHTPMGVKKSITLVKVPGKHLLLGLTNDRIELIAEIANEDIADGSEPVNKKEFLNLVKKSIAERKLR